MTIKRLGNVSPKFVTVELAEMIDDSIGLAVTITSLEHGAVTVGFTESESDELWHIFQNKYFEAEAENHKRRMNAQEN